MFKGILVNKATKMIENVTQDTLLVDLAPEPQMCEDLDSISETISPMADRDVVVDFSKADIVTASSLSKLLKLRQLLTDSGRRLVLCGLACNTRGVFKKTALDRVFEFASDKSVLLSNA